MKKIFATLMTLCLLATMFCVSAFAADESPVRVEFDTFGTTYAGSIFGNGSLAMVIALVALVVAVFSILLTLHLNKKKNNSETEKDDAESDNEE